MVGGGLSQEAMPGIPALHQSSRGTVRMWLNPARSPLSPGWSGVVTLATLPTTAVSEGPLAGEEGTATSGRATLNGEHCHPLILGQHKKIFSYSAIETKLQRDNFIAATSHPSQDLPGVVISVTGVSAVGAGEAASFMEH